jgi:hypothetical protein
MVAAQQAPTADRPLPPLPEPVRTASEVSLPRVAPSRRLSAPFHLCSPPPLLRWPFGCFGVARHLAAGVGGEARTRATGGMANTRAAIQPAEASPWSMAWRMLKATEAALNSTTSAHGYQVGRLARLAATTVRVGQDGRGDDGGRGSRCGRPCPPWPAPDAGAVVSPCPPQGVVAAPGRRCASGLLAFRSSASYTVQRAWVGDIRAARSAGSRPARAPMSRVAASPPAQARAGMTVAQCLVWA